MHKTNFRNHKTATVALKGRFDRLFLGELKTQNWPFKSLTWTEKQQVDWSPSKHKVHMWWPRRG